MAIHRDPASPPELVDVAQFIDGWLAGELAANEAIVDVTRDPDLEARWYVRMAGEVRDVTTVWLTLRQRTLAFEAYVLPHPQQNAGEVFERLLRWSHGLAGARFAIGDEDAIFIEGEIGTHAVDEHELDRILGVVYETVERFFRPLVRLGFGGAPDPSSADDKSS